MTLIRDLLFLAMILCNATGKMVWLDMDISIWHEAEVYPAAHPGEKEAEDEQEDEISDMARVVAH